jgi:hypothetical protein
MTWLLMRTGWPNTAMLFVLAIMPIIVVAWPGSDVSAPVVPAIVTGDSGPGEAEAHLAVLAGE